MGGNTYDNFPYQWCLSRAKSVYQSCSSHDHHTFVYGSVETLNRVNVHTEAKVSCCYQCFRLILVARVRQMGKGFAPLTVLGYMPQSSVPENGGSCHRENYLYSPFSSYESLKLLQVHSATEKQHQQNNILSSAKYLWLQSGGFQLVIYKCFLKQITYTVQALSLAHTPENSQTYMELAKTKSKYM